jgi:hypothetical protein
LLPITERPEEITERMSGLHTVASLAPYQPYREEKQKSAHGTGRYDHEAFLHIAATVDTIDA